MAGSSPQRESVDNPSSGGDVHAFTEFLTSLEPVILKLKTAAVEILSAIVFFKWLLKAFMKEMRR